MNVSGVSAAAGNVLAAVVLHGDSRNDAIRVVYRNTDEQLAEVTPWQSATLPVTVLGLKPGGRYSLQIQSSRGGSTTEGAPVEYAAPPLPPALAGIRMTVSGRFSGGYSLAPLPGEDDHGYLVAFDSAGTIRWYRDFGSNPVFSATQARNGNLIAYTGESSGFNVATGGFVEVTPTGDSVGFISAPAGSYTDPHDLVRTTDELGQPVSYFFSYYFRPFDRTSVGGGDADPVAIHQILALNEGGRVDTVFDGGAQWGIDESVEPPNIADLDHPNSIDIDSDGGLIVSYRDLNAVVKIDRGTRALLWQLGGVRNQFTIVGDPLGGFDGQHDAHVLPNGHLLLFDNGWNHTPEQSRAVEYALDTRTMTATMVWQYTPSPEIFNDFTGSAQRLASGNTLVAFTRNGIVDEVRPDGTLLACGSITLSAGRLGTPYRVTRINNLYTFGPP